MDIFSILKKSLLFSGVEDEYLRDVEKISNSREFSKGEILFSEGEAATGFYLLVKGSVKLCKVSPEGREKVLHFVRPGETFAEAAFFGDGKYPAEARGVEKGSVIFFPKEAFLELLRNNTKFSLNLIISLTQLLKGFARQIEDLSFAEVPNRLASYLLDLSDRNSKKFQNKIYLELDMKKGELASRLGTVSETLSRAFRKFKEDGIIEVEGSRVVILDLERLKIFAKGQG